MTEMVTSLTKENGIIEDLSLQDWPASWKNDNDQFTVPNPKDPCEQERLRKNSSGRSEYINRDIVSSIKS